MVTCGARGRGAAPWTGAAGAGEALWQRVCVGLHCGAPSVAGTQTTITRFLTKRTLATVLWAHTQHKSPLNGRSSQLDGQRRCVRVPPCRQALFPYTHDPNHLCCNCMQRSANPQQSSAAVKWACE